MAAVARVRVAAATGTVVAATVTAATVVAMAAAAATAAERTAPLGEAALSIDRILYPHRTAWDAHINELHAAVAHDKSVGAIAADKRVDAIRAGERGELVTLRGSAHRLRGAGVTHVDDLHAVVLLARHDGKRAVFDCERGDALRAFKHGQVSVAAVSRSAHRQWIGRVAQVNELHAVVPEARNDGVVRVVDDEGGDATCAVEFGELLTVRAAGVVHVDDLKAVVSKAHHDGVGALADREGADAGRLVEHVELAPSISCVAHRLRGAGVADINNLHAVVEVACDEGEGAGTSGEHCDASHVLEHMVGLVVRDVGAVRAGALVYQTAHNDRGVGVAHIHDLHAVVVLARNDGEGVVFDCERGDGDGASENLEAVYAVVRAAVARPAAVEGWAARARATVAKGSAVAATATVAKGSAATATATVARARVMAAVVTATAAAAMSGFPGRRTDSAMTGNGVDCVCSCCCTTRPLRTMPKAGHSHSGCRLAAARVVATKMRATAAECWAASATASAKAATGTAAAGLATAEAGLGDLRRRVGERGCRRDGSWRPGAPAATVAGTRRGG
eukprot:scaffold68996_cov59-Phaeocystis_antarctica.AAC.6